MIGQHAGEIIIVKKIFRRRELAGLRIDAFTEVEVTDDQVVVGCGERSGLWRCITSHKMGKNGVSLGSTIGLTGAAVGRDNLFAANQA